MLARMGHAAGNSIESAMTALRTGDIELARSVIARRVAGETAANSSQLTVPITVIHSHAPSPHPNHQARAAGTTRVTMSRMIRAAYCPHSFAPDSTPDTAACMAYMARPPAMSSTART